MHHDHQQQRAIAETSALLARAARVVVFSGAGLSAPSGLPVYRGEDGLYNDAVVEGAAHVETLHADPDASWLIWGPWRDAVAAAQPNAGHHAIADYSASARRPVVTVITQNVDDLHERAGSAPVWHLHGRVDRTACVGCEHVTEGDWVAHRHAPACSRCGNTLRPGMVFFGETIDAEAEWMAKRAIREADAFLAVGTSCIVYPAASLVHYAYDFDVPTILVDPRPELPRYVQTHLRGNAELLLPTLLGTSTSDA